MNKELQKNHILPINEKKQDAKLCLEFNPNFVKPTVCINHIHAYICMCVYVHTEKKDVKRNISKH